MSEPTPEEFDRIMGDLFPTLPPFPIKEWADPARRGVVTPHGHNSEPSDQG